MIHLFIKMISFYEFKHVNWNEFCDIVSSKSMHFSTEFQALLQKIHSLNFVSVDPTLFLKQIYFLNLLPVSNTYFWLNYLTKCCAFLLNVDFTCRNYFLVWNWYILAISFAKSYRRTFFGTPCRILTNSKNPNPILQTCEWSNSHLVSRSGSFLHFLVGLNQAGVWVPLSPVWGQRTDHVGVCQLSVALAFSSH